jgi:hypothetical protein
VAPSSAPVRSQHAAVVRRRFAQFDGMFTLYQPFRHWLFAALESILKSKEAPAVKPAILNCFFAAVSTSTTQRSEIHCNPAHTPRRVVAGRDDPDAGDCDGRRLAHWSNRSRNGNARPPTRILRTRLAAKRQSTCPASRPRTVSRSSWRSATSFILSTGYRFHGLPSVERLSYGDSRLSFGRSRGA